MTPSRTGQGNRYRGLMRSGRTGDLALFELDRALPSCVPAELDSVSPDDSIPRKGICFPEFRLSCYTAPMNHLILVAAGVAVAAFCIWRNGKCRKVSVHPKFRRGGRVLALDQRQTRLPVPCDG